MALSNLRNEPRREIIEQALGTIAVIGAIAADYALCNWLAVSVFRSSTPIADTVFGMLFSPLIFVCAVGTLIGAAHLAHAVGESVCGVLAKFGADPRPTTRYRG